MKLKGKFQQLWQKLSPMQQTGFLLALVLILSSLWRLTNLTLIEFKGDESLNLFLATRPLFGHPFPPASLASSVGILNFPLLNYFLFPLVLISYYPPFVSGCIALLNVLAIAWYFLFISKYFNRLTAFLSALLLAISPWAILYGRKIWAQDFLIPLIVPLLFCFFKIYTEKKQIYWLFFGIFSLFLIQIHQTTGILPILLFIPLVRKYRPNVIYLTVGILLGSLPLIPYVLFEVTHSCPDCLTFTQLHDKMQIYHPDIFFKIFQITTTGDFHSLLGNTDNLTFTLMYPLLTRLTKISYTIALLLPLSMIFFWKKYQEYRYFIGMTIGILCIFFALKIQSEMHYVILLLPFLFLFLGSFLSFLILSKRILYKLSGLTIVLFFFLFFMYFDFAFFHVLSIKKGFGGDYGGTYASASQAAQQALAPYKNSPDFPEMVLAFYVPKDSILGDTPVGQILYPLSQTEKQLNHLKQEMKRTPPDPRVFNQMLAFYTYPQQENQKTFFYLKDLAKKYPAYQTIYEKALGDYLYNNHKHYYTNANFWIEYPEHWHESENEESLTLSDEYVSLTMTKLHGAASIPDASWHKSVKTIYDQPSDQYTCQKQNKWCGNVIPAFILNGISYSLSMQPLQVLSQKIEQNERKVLESIISSLTSIY